MPMVPLKRLPITRKTWKKGLKKPIIRAVDKATGAKLTQRGELQ
tara:strand:+ start:1135 stop:1266 length:132 start_codon:yes stop_codon:yes gene_type:complete